MNEDWTTDVPANAPRLGDVITCSDGDVGICLRSYWVEVDVAGREGRLMVEVVWSQAGKALTDPWDAKAGSWFNDDLFQIASRA